MSNETERGGSVPSAHDFAQDYHFEFSNGTTYTPTQAERAMIEDVIEQWEASRG